MEAMHGTYRLEATMKASAPAGVMEARNSLHDGLMVGRAHGEQDRQRPRRRFLGDEGTQQRDRKPPVKPQKRTEGFNHCPKR